MWCKDKDFNSFAIDFTNLITDGFWGAFSRFTLQSFKTLLSQVSKGFPLQSGLFSTLRRGKS